MSTAVTMEELEFETAELLPSRETLGSCSPCHHQGIAVAAAAAAAVSGGCGGLAAAAALAIAVG